MLRKYKYICLVFAVLFLLGVTQQANALLSAVGPTDPVNGFPLWYQDGNTQSLDLCLNQTPSVPGGPGTFMCNLLPDAAFDPNVAIAFPTNFPQESFYFAADARISTQQATKATYRAAVQAGFALGPVTPGQQFTFSLIKYTISVPAPGGTYTVTHPYGVETYNDVAPGPAAIKFVNKTPGISFADPLTGAVGPYLSRVAGPIAIGGLTFLGDPNVAEAVTGSPTGVNKFRIDGPNIGGPGINFVETNLFALTGLATGGVVPTPVTVQTATYSRGATSGVIDVFVASSAGAAVTVSGVGTPLPGEPIPLTEGTAGAFFVHILLPDATVLPTALSVSAQGGAGTALTTAQPHPLADVVNVTKALYNPTAHSLTVQAASSDQGAAAPALSVTSLGIFPTPTLARDNVGVPTVVIPLLAPPPTVTVASSAGGSAVASVQTVPPAEKLKLTSVTFSKAKGTWNIVGHSSMPGVVVKAYNSPDLTPPLLGKATTDRLGLFHIKLKGAKGKKLPNAEHMISLKSSGKGKVMNKKVRVIH
jgi:hypothetical protein